MVERFNDLPMGKIDVVTDTDRLGQRYFFNDLDYSSTETITPQLTSMEVEALLVINDSGGTLKAGDICRWDIGATYGPGRGVDAAAVADTAVGVGAVDPWISTTVGDGETFLLVVRGPCKLLSTTGTAVAIGDVLALGAAGRAIVYDAPGSDTTTGNRDRCGRALEVVASGAADDTLFRAYVDFRV